MAEPPVHAHHPRRQDAGTVPARLSARIEGRAAVNEPTIPPPRTFPIQSERGAAPHPIRISWETAELAYSVYSGMYGRGQSLERLAERGGFGPSEMDTFLPDWRTRESLLAQWQLKCHAAESQLTAIRSLLTPLLGTEVCTVMTRAEKAEAENAKLRADLAEAVEALARYTPPSCVQAAAIVAKHKGKQ